MSLEPLGPLRVLGPLGRVVPCPLESSCALLCFHIGCLSFTDAFTCEWYFLATELIVTSFYYLFIKPVPSQAAVSCPSVDETPPPPRVVCSEKLPPIVPLQRLLFYCNLCGHSPLILTGCFLFFTPFFANARNSCVCENAF